MKIYTYYQNINHPSQNELIDLWKISWSRKGYEPKYNQYLKAGYPFV